MRRMIEDAAAPSPPRSRDSAVSYRLRATSRWPAASARPASSINVATSGDSACLAIGPSGDGRLERRRPNHLLRDRRARDAQQPRRRGLIAASELEGECNGLGDDVVERLTARRNTDLADRVWRRGASGTPLNHQVLGAHERRIAAQDRRAFDHVLQLANIAGPAVNAQGRERVGRELLGLVILAILVTEE